VRPDDRFCPNCGANVRASSGSLPGQTVASRWDQLLERVRAAVAPRYRVERVLGYGGMAGVYLADETRLARSVAIKVMAPELMLDQTLIHRFQQEAQTIAQLRHPNIVAVHNIDESDGLHYFVMEYVPGRTLAQVIAAEGGRIPIHAILHWLSQVGSALDYGHRQGIVHRDVKPGNVLLDADGNALVSDFGIAKASDAPGLTRTGMLVGTPAYVSPEYCLTGAASGASDQYSLGILAFEALTGRPPFTGPTIATLQAHLNEPPPSLVELRSDCPAPVRYAVERMLAKKPEDRFPDIRGALAAMGAEPLPHDHPLRPTLIALSRAAEGEGEGAAPGVEVTPAPVEKIELEPIPGPVSSGSSVRMKARILTDGGGEVTGPIDWSTSNPNVAVITRDGWVEARNPGTAVIIASVGEQTAAAFLTVEAPAVAHPPEELRAGPDPDLAATGAPQEATPLRAAEVRATGRRARPRWLAPAAVAVLAASAGGVYLARRGDRQASASAAPTAASVAAEGPPNPGPLPARAEETAGKQSASASGSPTPEASAPAALSVQLPAETRNRPAGSDAQQPRKADAAGTPQVASREAAPVQSIAAKPTAPTPQNPASSQPGAGAPGALQSSVPPPSSATAAVDRSAAQIRETVNGFVRSIEARDVKRIESLYPDASKEWLTQWGPFLTNRRDVRDLQASITDFGQPETAGGAGQVRFTILLEWNDLRNARQQQRLNMTATLREEGGDWMIRSLQSER
jgi:hypothetical protein